MKQGKRILMLLLAVMIVTTLFPAVAGAADTATVNVTIQDGDGTGTVSLEIGGETKSFTGAGGQLDNVLAGVQMTLSWADTENDYVEEVLIDGVPVVGNVTSVLVTAPAAGETMNIVVSYDQKPVEYNINFGTAGEGSGVILFAPEGGELAEAPDAVTVNDGERITIGWEENKGSYLHSFEVNGKTIIPTNHTYSFVVEQPTSVIARFEKTLELTAEISDGGILHVLEYGKWGGVAGGMPMELAPGKQTFHASPMDGYALYSVKLNGQDVSFAADDAGGYTFDIDLRQDGSTLSVLFLHAGETGTDEATGIMYFLPKQGNITPGSFLRIEPVMQGTAFTSAQNAAAKWGGIVKLYDITLCDEAGNAYQPNTSITIIFPVPQGYEPGALRLLHINGNGVAEELPFTVEQYPDGTYLETQTTSFSQFAIVDANAAVTNGKNTPKTDDPANIGSYLVLLGVAAGLAIWTASKRRKAKTEQ